MSRTPDFEKHQTFWDLDVEKINPINNRVLCRKLTNNIKEKNNHGLYYPEQYHQNQYLHQNSDIVFEVIAAPDILTEEGGRWKTTIEVIPGDLVWVDRTRSLHAPEVKGADGAVYRLISYYDLIVAKRRTHNFTWGEPGQYIVSDEGTFTVIPLNGYILCSDIMVKQEDVGVIHNPGAGNFVSHRTKATVEYVGKRNEYYTISKSRKPDLDTTEEITPKQTIHLMDYNKNETININRNYLEDEMYSRFNGKKMYFYIQRPDINAILYE